MSDVNGDANFSPPPPPPPPPGLAAPPGYVSYGENNQGAYSSLQAVGGSGRTLGILVMVLIPIQLLLILFYTVAHSKAQDFINGSINEDKFKRGVVLYGLFGIISFAVQVAILVLTMVWMSKMARNQQALGRAGTWGPGWAIGGWFAPPCVLYVIPYLMFRDLWKASDPQSSPDWKKNRVAPIVTIWWVLFGLAPLAFLGVTVGNFRARGNRNNLDAAKDIVDHFGSTLASSIVAVGAAVAYLLLVRQLTARHQRAIHEA